MDVAFGHGDRREHLVQQLTSPPDEWLALDVFVPARRLSDQHQRRGGGAAIEAELAGGGLQCAAVEPRQGFAEFLERAGLA